MSMFPHTITVYNLDEDQATFEKIYNITVLRGVLLDATHASNIMKSGLSNADSVMVYVPFSVDANGKSYLPPKEYEKAQDKTVHWTIRPNTDFFIKGEVVEAGRDYQQLNQQYDDVYNVTTVDTKDFGSPDLRHWEVGGR